MLGREAVIVRGGKKRTEGDAVHSVEAEVEERVPRRPQSLEVGCSAEASAWSAAGRGFETTREQGRTADGDLGPFNLGRELDERLDGSGERVVGLGRVEHEQVVVGRAWAEERVLLERRNAGSPVSPRVARRDSGGETHEQRRKLWSPADDEQQGREDVLLGDRGQDVLEPLDVVGVAGRTVGARRARQRAHSRGGGRGGRSASGRRTPTEGCTQTRRG